jgi:hypothetical protein
MKIKNKLRSAAELTISMTIIATLLAACGGGGGSTAATAAAGTNTVNVTPGKGLMYGATVTITDTAGLVLGTGTTTGAGFAGIAIPSTATGPFVVSVSCLTAACTYFDEKTGLSVTGSAAMPALQAVVPGVVANIGVTAATNAAAQYALNTGAALTATSIVAANTTVATQLGLPGIDILTPPTIIGTAAAYTAAKAGTTAADKLASLSAAFAMSASGVSAMQAIADYGNAWKVAAMTPASGVVMPATINAAAMIAATSGVAGMTGIPTATIPNVASTVAAAGTAATASITATNNLIAAGTSTTGLRAYNQQSALSSASAVATVTTLAAGATAGSYNATGVIDRLVGGAWSAAIIGQGRSYMLGTAGWVLDNGSFTAVNNNNGTITTTSPVEGTYTVTIQETVLDGMLVNPAPATATFPVGSRQYVGLGGVTSKATFGLGFGSQVTDMSGVALTALPTIGTAFCANGFAFNPITPLTQTLATSQGAAIGDNYEILGLNGGSCTAAAITTGMLNALGVTPGLMGMGFATVTTMTTGITATPSVGYISRVGANTANAFSVTNAVSLTNLNACIMGVPAGVAKVGCPLNGKGQGFTPAQTPIPFAVLNKKAFDGLLTANGFPVLP